VGVNTPQHNWVRRAEHVVLRIVSFIFSVVSAHAILWFFSALDRVDQLQPFVKWGIACGFGVLGYFVSRGLAHRLLNKERVRAYVFICGVFELVEVVCNFAMASVAVQWVTWLGILPGLQHQVLTLLTYVVLSIIPVVTVMLAWVDMDLERAKQGYVVQGFGAVPQGQGMMPRGVPGMAGPRPVVFPQPRTAGASTLHPPLSPAVPPRAGQMVSPLTPASPAAEVAPSQSSPWWRGMLERLPFAGQEQAVPQPAPATMAPPSAPLMTYGAQTSGMNGAAPAEQFH